MIIEPIFLKSVVIAANMTAILIFLRARVCLTQNVGAYAILRAFQPNNQTDPVCTTLGPLSSVISKHEFHNFLAFEYALCSSYLYHIVIIELTLF